jgi:hypothetical protein
MVFGVLLGGRELLVFLGLGPFFWSIHMLFIACYVCLCSNFSYCDMMFG